MTNLITIDVDWAPDWCIEWLVGELESRGWKATIFTTHLSKSIKSLSENFEIGIHPDFSRYDWNESCRNFNELRNQLPKAIGSRSHRNVFGQNIAKLLSDYGILYDCSTLLYLRETISWKDQFGLNRLTYGWEDGIHLDMNGSKNNSFFKNQEKTLKIFNIHPVLMYLNSKNDFERKRFTSKYSDLTKVKRKEVDQYINKENGIWNTFQEFLHTAQKPENFFLQDYYLL